MARLSWNAFSPLVLLLVVVVLTAISSTAASGLGGRLGGKTNVKDVKTNQEIQDLGRYSVEQYNMQQGRKNGGDLRFHEVVEAETQVVSGYKYYLKIAASSRNGVPMTFDAEVVVKPWAHFKELLNFSPSPTTK